MDGICWCRGTADPSFDTVTWKHQNEAQYSFRHRTWGGASVVILGHYYNKICGAWAASYLCGAWAGFLIGTEACQAKLLLLAALGFALSFPFSAPQSVESVGWVFQVVG